MSRSTPIEIIIHSPTTVEGQKSLAKQVAAAHAEQVRRYVQSLNFPGEQKKQLVAAILASER